MTQPVSLHRTLDQELLALFRGVSLECLVCGEFVLHTGGAIECPECGTKVHAARRHAEAGVQFRLQAG
jgi:DNA-directed RNA polymerase subunit RPC12/RpoP